MKLTQDQLREYDDKGYLFLPDCFSADEVAVLKREADAIFTVPRPEMRMEKSGAPRMAFAVHKYNDAYRALFNDARLVRPVEQIFGEPVYIHQSKINAKAAFEGDLWWWHQDFVTWRDEDGMPAARAMNVAIFLDDVADINGPLMVIPGSHHRGPQDPFLDDKMVSHHGLYTPNAAVKAAADEGGIVAPVGKAGSVLMFHANIIHGSTSNITPYARKLVYLTLNAVSNHIRDGKQTRPDHIAHRDFTPIDAEEGAFAAFLNPELAPALEPVH